MLEELLEHYKHSYSVGDVVGLLGTNLMIRKGDLEESGYVKRKTGHTDGRKAWNKILTR